MQDDTVTVLGTGEALDLSACRPVPWAGTQLQATPDGRWVAAAFRRHVAVVADSGALPDPDDEAAAGDLVLRWVEQVRAHDWSALRGAPLEGEGDWLDLRTAMVRVGWGPGAVQHAWEAVRRRPYASNLPTAAGWAAAGWVVPAVADEPDPAFARPVLETRGLLRWSYITRWAEPVEIPPPPLPTAPEPADGEWADVLSRLRQDHYAGDSVEAAEELAIGVLRSAGLGPRNVIEAEDEPLPERDVRPACEHPSPLVRAAAWFLLRAEADEWLACGYGECQHHWGVEAEEDAYEQEEVLELAGYGVVNPVDAAYQRRRLLTLAFGDVNDVPLAGAGDVEEFVAFYNDWVARGRPEEEFQAAVHDLRGDDES
jgi:hypothetical protein